VIFSCDDFKELRVNSAKKSVIFTTDFIRPIHIVLASNACVYGNFEVSFTKHHDYAINMNYHHPSDIDTIDGMHHSKAIKLKSKFDNDEQVAKILDIISYNSYLDDDTISTLSTIIAELFQNFYSHAEYDKPPICCVQSWKNGYLEIAIADKGIGIEKSLKDILLDYPGEDHCELACRNGISSKLGKNHSGYGLFFTKRFIEENYGKMFLMSGSSCYSVSKYTSKVDRLPYIWNGTAIRLIINKSKSINAEEFFKTMTMEQGDYDEYF
jgi:anti-sigma regulatory factor (Ser/Thr protein kinase)